MVPTLSLQIRSRLLIAVSRQLIQSSTVRQRSTAERIRRSLLRIPPRLTGGSDVDRVEATTKAPACGHNYTTIEIGRDETFAIEEATSLRQHMLGVYVSAPFRRDGLPWLVALCRECAA